MPTGHVAFDTDTGNWMSLDISPDEAAIVFALPAGGGQATRIAGGLPFDSQPRFSPNGSMICFVSDRSGNENLWFAGADGSEPRALSSLDDNSEFVSPAWSADGRSVFVSRYLSFHGAMEIWRHAPDASRRRGSPATATTRCRRTFAPARWERRHRRTGGSCILPRSPDRSRIRRKRSAGRTSLAASNQASSPTCSVLDRDPRADIRNTLSLSQVMKNGRFYDAGTLDELRSEPRPLPPLWFWNEAPPATASADWLPQPPALPEAGAAP